MIDNYINTIESVLLYAYLNGTRVSADATPTATAIDIETGLTVQLNAVEVVDSGNGYNYYSVSLSPMEVSTTRQVLVSWEYDVNAVTLVRTDIVNVFRPYFEPDDLWEQFPEYGPGGENELSVDEVKLLERNVRYRIDEYCRQSFQDFGLDTVKFRGGGDNGLILNRRIYRLESVTTGELVLFNRDINDNVDVNLVDWHEEFPDSIIKSQSSQSVSRYEEDPVLYGLQRSRSVFKDNQIYDVQAYFGWQYMPVRVHQAAVLLANDTLCAEDRYRQKNVTVVRSSDYRIEYGTDHRVSTGNVDVDNMLASYINTGGYVF